MNAYTVLFDLLEKGSKYMIEIFILLMGNQMAETICFGKVDSD